MHAKFDSLSMHTAFLCTYNHIWLTIQKPFLRKDIQSPKRCLFPFQMRPLNQKIPRFEKSSLESGWRVCSQPYSTWFLSFSGQAVQPGWPDWANFRFLADNFMWLGFWKLQKEPKHLGHLFQRKSYAFMMANKRVGLLLAIFPNSSGHPVSNFSAHCGPTN
jgi:hypothetical protein